MLCKVLKLNTGEVILGNITEEARSYIDVHRPVRVIMQPRGDGVVSVGLVKWEMVSDFDSPVRVFKHALVSVSEPTEEFRLNYIDVYENYESKESAEEEETEESRTVDDLANDLNKIEEMFKAIMESNTKVTLH
jgi:hypothetical protein